MKRFLSILLLFVLCLSLVACGEEKVSFDVDENINEEVEISAEAEEKLAEAIQTLGILKEEPKEELVEEIQEGITPELEKARISSDKIIKIADLVIDNKDKLSIDENNITKDNIKMIVFGVEKVLDILGDDFLGLYIANTALEFQDEFDISKFDILEYSVINSRFTVKSLKQILKSIDDADIDAIYNAYTKLEKDENLEGKDIRPLLDVLSDMLDSIKFSDSSWEQLAEMSSKKVDVLLEAIDSVGVAPTELTKIINVEKLKKVIVETTLKTPLFIKSAKAVVDGFTTEVIDELVKDFNYDFNNKYYINGEEVTKEDYKVAKNKNELNVFVFINNVVNNLSKEEIKELEEYYILVCNLINDAVINLMKEYNPEFKEEDIKFEGENITLDELIQIFEDITKLDYASETFEDSLDELEEKLEKGLLNYLYSKAPTLKLLLGGF